MVGCYVGIVNYCLVKSGRQHLEETKLV